jgi:ribosomal protein S18 acetylase RimI-like enzyme
MTLRVDVVVASSPGLLESLNRLLPQLSTSATPLTSKQLDALLRNEAVSLLVATEDDAIVGTLTLAIFPLPSGVRAWIEDVIVDEGARGRGVGEALCQHALDLARVRGVRRVDLTSRPSREAANALYQRLGFEIRETNVYRRLIKEDELE